MEKIYSTLNELEQAIRNNDNFLLNKMLCEIEVETDFKEKNVIDMCNHLYADESVQLVRKSICGIKVLTVFEIKTNIKIFDVVLRVFENYIGWLYIYDVENHYKAVKNIVNLINSLTDEVIEYYNGKPEIKKVSDEIHRLCEISSNCTNIDESVERLEFYYLFELETEIADSLLSVEEHNNWHDAYDSWDAGLHI